MKGIYKKDRELYLFEFTPYRSLAWKNLIKTKTVLAPKVYFHRRGLLFLYSLKNCIVVDDKLVFKGEEVDLLKLSR